jgi:hypothetical protein
VITSRVVPRPRTARSSPLGDPWLTAALWTLAIVAVAAAARLLVWYWPGRVFDGVTSHIWTALAWDLAHGHFYRPLLGPDGYGGTRYMPLMFGMQALLMRLGFDPIHAGVLLMQGSVLAAAAALYAALRAYQVPRRLAAPLALAVFGTVIYQQYCTDLDPDYLASALAMSSVPLTVRSGRHNQLRWLFAAGLGVVLAALTKVTALAYLAPIAWWLVTSGRARAAAWFVLGTIALFTAAAGLVEVASHGAFLESFRATISGGMESADVWRAVPKFFREIAIDPLVAVPCIVACWSAFVRFGRFGLPQMILVTVSAITLVIFASPGTVGNHLVDLHIASLLVAGVGIADGQLPVRAAAAVFGGMAVALAAISLPVPGIPSVIATLRAQALPSRALVQAIHGEFLSQGTRYLSTDPVIAVLYDERPILLDAFNLSRFIREGTAAGRDLEQRLRRHDFAVVIVREDPQASQNRNDLDRLIHSAYDVSAVRSPFVVLVPRADASPASDRQ